MMWKGSSFPSRSTCRRGLSPPTASAEQSSLQDKTAAVLLLGPWWDYSYPAPCNPFSSTEMRLKFLRHFKK